MKNSTILFIFLVTTFLIVGVTQYEYYFFRNELNALKVPVAKEQQSPTSTPATDTEPRKTQIEFIAQGSIVTRIFPDGKSEVILDTKGLIPATGPGTDVDVVATLDDTTAIVKASCWEGGGIDQLYRLDAVSKKLTAMRSGAACRNYLSPRDANLDHPYLIYPGEKGDSFIKVDLVEDTSQEVGKLPKPYTYIATLDESGYTPFVIGDVEWNYGAFAVDVFDGGVPLELFETRLPIMKKRI